MKKKSVIIFLLLTIFVFFFGLCVGAESFESYTYLVKNGEATITFCEPTVKGRVEIPLSLQP